MGQRGPKPKPKRTLLKRGSRRARNASDDLVLPPKIPSAPAWLDREAKAEWKRLTKLLGPKQVLTEGDRSALAMMCSLWSTILELMKAEKNVRQDPMSWKRFHSMRIASIEKWASLLGRFGLTPADRPRVKVPDTQETHDADAAFFGPRIVKSG